MSTPSISLPRVRGARTDVTARTLPVPRPELWLLLVLAAALNLWALSRNGFANEYYSAAVRAMSTSWHAFLYGSFDAAGVMTVDKPPLALWVQALSARVFGFSSWSMLVPQALMGVASVALAYDLTRRRFGRAAGFAAGLVLALTPVTVAISRHNNPDALLALCATASLWFVVRGLEDGRTRWLVLSGVAIGLGFETKMAAALLVVPALAAAWLWVAPRGRVVAARQLLAGGAAMAAVALAWPVLVWLTPAADRPWVSGTERQQHLVADLRLQRPGPAVRPGRRARWRRRSRRRRRGRERRVRRRAGSAAAAQREPWRAGRLAAGLRGGRGPAVLAATRLRRADARTGWLIAAGGSFLTIAVAFSTAEGIFHPYYTSQLAPFTAVLVGAGAAELARGGRLARRRRPRGDRSRRDRGARRAGRQPGLPGLAAARAGRRGRHRGDRARRGHRRPGARHRRRRHARPAPARPGDVGGADRRPRHERDVPRGRPGRDRDARGARRARRPPARRRRRRTARPAAQAGSSPAAVAAASAATPAPWPRRSPTPRRTAAARSPWPASPAQPAS